MLERRKQEMCPYVGASCTQCVEAKYLPEVCLLKTALSIPKRTYRKIPRKRPFRSSATITISQSWKFCKLFNKRPIRPDNRPCLNIPSFFCACERELGAFPVFYGRSSLHGLYIFYAEVSSTCWTGAKTPHEIRSAWRLMHTLVFDYFAKGGLFTGSHIWVHCSPGMLRTSWHL